MENLETISEAGSEVVTVNCACAEENSEFVTGQDIAKMFKVSNSTVNLWKRQGMPFFGKSSCARFNKNEVITWQRGQSQLPITKGKRVKKEEIVA
jgi:phage terminase Nu1 subunit (DNA packaging protein)